METSRLARDGTAEPVSRDQILRHERGKGNIHFPCSADHVVQDWQPYPVDRYSCSICVTIHTGGLLPDIILLTQCCHHSLGNPFKCHENVCLCNL